MMPVMQEHLVYHVGCKSHLWQKCLVQDGVYLCDLKLPAMKNFLCECAHHQMWTYKHNSLL